MKTSPSVRVAAVAAILAVFLINGPAYGQPILSIDFNDRGQSASTTMPGFDAFEITTTAGTGAQSNATVRPVGAYTVTVASSGSGITYDDRLRPDPQDGGDFTQSLLLRDFVFCGSATSGTGLDITIDGLESNQVYLVRIWSFDVSSTGNRVSDWSVNGTLLQADYVFNGANPPTDNTQNVFTMKAVATDQGRLLIQGRRDAATASAGSVFVNALQLEVAPPDPPVFIEHPADTTVYEGENVILNTMVSGTAPIDFQWYAAGMPIVDATNHTLILGKLSVGAHGPYSVTISNLVGVETSFEANVLVNPVTDIANALLAYWPLDELTEATPDASGNGNVLLATNMFATNVVTGQRANALYFESTNTMLIGDVTVSATLPASSHPAYSVAMWVKGSFSNQLDRRVFSESSTTNQQPLLNIGTHNQAANGAVDIFIRNDNGGNPVNHRHSTRMAFDDTWHHIAWVDDRGFARLYVDGVLDATDFTYARGELTATTLTLGGILRADPSHWFTGAIDDTAVWGRPLSAHEVQYVMLLGAEPYPLDVIDLLPELPADTAVNEGRSVTLRCGLYGQGAAYQWYFGDQIIEGATQPALTLASALPDNAGNYLVVATGPNNSITSRVATLTVVPPPTNVMLTAEAIVPPAPGSDTFALNVPTIIGYSYTLEFADQLTMPASNIVWTAVMGAAVQGDGNPQSLSDTNATAPWRYYRLRMTPIP